MYDDDFDDIEDRWEPSRPSGGLPPDRPPPSDGRRTLVALTVALGVMIVVGVGAFIAGGAVGSHTDTIEKTVTDVVTATAPPDDNTDTGALTAPNGDGVDCSQGPSKSKGYEPNDTAERAAGPLLSGQPLKGELRATQDIDYWILCVSQPTQVTFNLVCARGACNDVLATFPADADFANTFGTDKPLTCRLPRAGHYRVAIDSEVVPVIYRISVEAKDPSVIADKVPPDFPDEAVDVTC